MKSCVHGLAGGLNGAECLRLKPGMEQIASRLETRRFLAYLGGTTEFTKWEGKMSTASGWHHCQAWLLRKTAVADCVAGDVYNLLSDMLMVDANGQPSHYL